MKHAKTVKIPEQVDHFMRVQLGHIFHCWDQYQNQENQESFMDSCYLYYKKENGGPQLLTKRKF